MDLIISVPEFQIILTLQMQHFLEGTCTRANKIR